jgi:hypothetical protein
VHCLESVSILEHVSDVRCSEGLRLLDSRPGEAWKQSLFSASRDNRDLEMRLLLSGQEVRTTSNAGGHHVDAMLCSV